MTEITQADRDAAAAIVYEENKDGLKWASAKGMRDHVAAGKWDWHPTVQAFARHREQAERETVAKIVAWLRTDPDAAYKPADAIEAGEWKANFDDHPLTSNQLDDHETGNVSDKLRDAVEVWEEANSAYFGPYERRGWYRDAAIAIIEADRQAVRAALVAEIAAWLRKEAPAALCDPRMVGNAIEAKWGK